MPTPADEHQGHAKLDCASRDQQFARRPLQHGPLEEGQRERRPQPAGTGFIWDNNVDTGARHVHDGLLRQDAERGSRPASRYTDQPRRASASASSIVRQGYSTSGGNDQGTWGVLPEDTYDLSATLSLWSGNHTMKTGASFTYDVTKQLFAPLQNGRYTLRGLADGGAQPVPVRAGVRAHARGAADVSEAYVLGGFFQDDWRVQQQPDDQPRACATTSRSSRTFLIGRLARTRTTSTHGSGLPGIRRAIRSGSCAAALAALRSSTRSSRS